MYDSGAFDTFKNYTGLVSHSSLTDRKHILKNVEVSGTELDCILFIQNNLEAIGFISYGTAKYLVKEGFNVKILSLDGIQPKEENILNGKYPIKRELNLVYKTKNDRIRGFLDFTLNDESQKILKDLNFIPVNVVKNK